MRSIISALGAALVVALVPAAASAGPPAFNTPVKLTKVQGFGGYEPGLVVDNFGNIVVTAHKQNHGDVVSPDPDAPTQARSASWVWWSHDSGKTFSDMPGITPLDEQNLEFGDEGDVATDNANHLYFVDTNVGDVTFSRWSSTGLGDMTLEMTRPVLPAGEPVDDRPWVIAHGDGHVFYLGNEGDKATYPLGSSGHDGDANGPGRYTVYRSTDGGTTFDSVGYTLKDSGWCRPAHDRRSTGGGLRQVFVLCTNDDNANALQQNGVGSASGPALLYSYVSDDDGVKFNRYLAGHYNGNDPWSTWPSLTVAPNGTIYGLYVDDDTDSNGNPVNSHLDLLTSKDGGRSWSTRDVTPAKGLIRYSWLDVAPNGTVGIAYYYRPNTNSDWHVYAGTSKDGKHFDVAQVTSQPVASKGFSEPFGDFFEVAFGPDNKLNVVWTYQNTDLVAEGLNTDIYFAHQK